MRSDHLGICRSCGDPVVWATTATTSKAIPLTRDPGESVPKDFGDEDPRGRIQEVARELSLFDDGSAPRPLVVRVLGEGEEVRPGPVWRSHFADCRHAKTWRRAGG